MYKSFVFTVFFLSFVLANRFKLEGMRPCHSDDLPCIQSITTNFLKVLAGGNHALNEKKFDPFKVPSIHVPACCGTPPTSTLNLSNIEATGLGTASLVYFKIDKREKNTAIKLQVDLKITADMVYEKNDKSKSLSGTTEMKAKCLLTFEFPYEITVDGNGVEHFVPQSETVTCEVLEDPEFKHSDELEQGLTSDPDFKKARSENGEKFVEARKRFACRVLKTGFSTVVQALRKYCHAVPRHDYLADEKLTL